MNDECRPEVHWLTGLHRRQGQGRPGRHARDPGQGITRLTAGSSRATGPDRRNLNMPRTTTYTAEITDPITGDTVILTVASEGELEQLVDRHLREKYPDPQEDEPAAPATSE